MNPRRRHAALAFAGACTLAAAAWVSQHDEQAEVLAMPAKSVRTETARADRAPAPPMPETKAELQRVPFPEAPADPFAARSWTPSVAEKPAPPAAPAVPYTYFGRMTEDGKSYVFLQRGERSYTVKTGDLLDQQYRIDDITPTAVVLTYLPLKERQVLHTGS